MLFDSTMSSDRYISCFVVFLSHISPWIHLMVNKRREHGSWWKSVQFSYSAAAAAKPHQSCPILWDPMDRSMPGLPVHHQLLEFTQSHVHWVGDAIQPSHPLSFPPPPIFNLSQHQGLFKIDRIDTIALLEIRSEHQYWAFQSQEEEGDLVI